MKKPTLELVDVHFSYQLEGQTVPALKGISLQIEEGEMVAIQGPSGSGKSTLLYLLGCMLKPDRGQILLQGQDVSQLSDVALAYIRNRRLGFVFQQFHLLPATDVLDNILLPTHYPLEESGEEKDFKARALQLAQQLGLGERVHHKTQQLSGGQQQRVAIARALIRDAPIILADEPTGNLDSKTSQEILSQLRDLNKTGKTIVIITHDSEVAKQCDRVIWIRDGQVINTGEKTAGTGKPVVAPDAEIPHLSGLKFGTLIRQSLPRAIENIRRNRVRSLLTMVGVVVGVASVLAMVTLGSFTQEKILESYASLGVNTVMFSADRNWFLRASDRQPNAFRALELEHDVFPLKEIFPEIRSLSPYYGSYNHSAVFGGRSIENEVSLFGIDENALPIMRRFLAVGGSINKYHVQNRSSVCVIGYEIAQRLFQRRTPIGESLRLGLDDAYFSCTIVGVSLPAHKSDGRWNADLQVFVPYTVFQSLPVYWYYRQLHQIVLEIYPGADTEIAGKKIQAFYEKRYGKSGRFRASSDTVLVAQMKRFLNLFTLLLVAIAALSLLVGGMGITNVMLVSVNERFREIGLRKALGASHHAIRQLFFAESLFLCGMAGGIGVIAGFAAYETAIYFGSKVVPNLKFEWVFNPWGFLISFCAILLTGILSGLGPALKAEKLQVIEALRSE